jgi:type VII secretion integral membrane protein EccD
VTATTGVAFTRVTVVAPTRRFDLALPSDVAFADLLPTLLRIAGEDSIAGSATGWVLHRLGQHPFDNQQSATTYSLRDGEVLYLAVAEAAVREIVFDDVAEAIARNAKSESARWAPTTTRTFGAAAAGTLVALTSLVCLFAGPSMVWSAIAGGLAVLLLGTGVVLSRAFGDSRIGALFGFTALPYAFIAGLFAPGDVDALSQLGNPHLLSGFTTITLAAMIAMVGISDAVHLFLGTTAAGTLGAIGALVIAASDLEPAGAAALVAGAATALTPLLPAVSLRLAQLPLPHIPTDPDDVRHDEQPAYDATLLDQAHAADQFLTGLVSATAIVVAVCDVMLVAEGGAWGSVLVVVMSLSLMLRARHLPGLGQRLVLLIAGLIGLIVVSGGVFVVAGQPLRIFLLIGGVLIGAISLLVGLRWPNARRSPQWASLAHLAELLLVVAIFPIALAVLDAYGWARALFG